MSFLDKDGAKLFAEKTKALASLTAQKVDYKKAQSLTDAEKAQARENIGAVNDFNKLENIPCGTVVKGDTITLDDALTELPNSGYVKVSDCVPTKEDLANGFTMVFKYRGTITTATSDGSAYVSDLSDGSYVLKYSVADPVKIYPEDTGDITKGTYFAHSPNASVAVVGQSLTINGYEFTEVKKLDEKYLPDSVLTEEDLEGIGGIDVSGATPGQITKVKAVDEKGKPTEWEAVDMPTSLELDTTLSDSTKAAPADMLGQVKTTAEAAVHGIITASEGALVVSPMEAYAKLMNGEVVMGELVHVSDKVPTMADLEAGYAMMMATYVNEPPEPFTGMNGYTMEIPPKALDEGTFAAFTMEMYGLIMCGSEMVGVFIVPTDNFAIAEIGMSFPKKGVYILPGITAFRINGYSFSKGTDSGVTYEYSDTVTFGRLIGRNISEFTNFVSNTNNDGTQVVAIKLAEGTEPTLDLLNAGVQVSATAIDGSVVYETITGWESPVPGVYYVAGSEILQYVSAASGFAPPGFGNSWAAIVVADADGVILDESIEIETIKIPDYNGFKVEVEGGSSAIPDAKLLYTDQTYIYRVPDTSLESNRVTATELRAMVKSGSKILVSVSGIGSVEMFCNPIASYIDPTVGGMALGMPGPNGNLLSQYIYTAEYTPSTTEVTT